MEEKDYSQLMILIKAGNFLGLRDELVEMNEVDIAEFLEELEPEILVRVFRVLPKDISADVFSYLETESQEWIVRSITDTEVYALVDDLYLDDVVDFLEEVPANVVSRVLRNTNPQTRKLINTYLNYPEDSAGSIMTNEMIDLKDSYTVSHAIDHIRKHGEDKVSVYTAFITDPSRHLRGSIDLAELLYAAPDDLIKDIMDDDKQLLFVHTLDDQEEVAEMVTKYDLLSVPVVDKENRLVGIITVDDIVDILQEEATEDIEKMAAIVPTDKPYLKTNAVETFAKRIPWLLILMLSATFTGAVITRYENALASYVILTAYIPMIMGTGGNAASQASVSVIRGLSLGDVTFADTFRVLWKEIRVALLCGAVLAVCNFGKMMVLDRVGVPMALIVSATLVPAVLIAKFVGCILPILADKVHLDPAVMASPLITTIVDALSLVAYFKIATAALHIAV